MHIADVQVAFTRTSKGKQGAAAAVKAAPIQAKFLPTSLQVTRHGFGNIFNQQ
jgi:hypothetical protein